MGDIPLMRAGLLLLVVIAALGGLSLVVLPDQRTREGERAGVVAGAADTSAAGTPAPGDSAAGDAARGFACRVDAAGVALPEAVHESSGLALTGAGDALWTHNDSGRPVLYRVGMDGSARGAVAVTGAENTDWEDLAAGPCPGSGRCLFVADIGDNQARRERITIYRVPEPAPGETRTRRADALHAVYPDGPRDAEALFVLPDGAVYVVTKGEMQGIGLYELPRDARPGAVARLRHVAELRTGSVNRAERITGAAASPDGQWIALRTLRALHVHRTGALASGGLGEPLTFDLRPLDEAQGEAVAFGAGGVVHLSSEGGKRENPATLARLTCTFPTP